MNMSTYISKPIKILVIKLLLRACSLSGLNSYLISACIKYAWQCTKP